MNVARMAAGVVLLLTIGYLGASNLWIPAALAGVVALGGWAAIAWRHPRAVLGASFVFVLLAGTKFRIRSAEASLEGQLDAQIVLELILYAAIGVAVATICMATLVRERRWRRPSAAEYVALVYGVIALLSTFWSVAPVLTLVRAAQLLVLLAFAMTSVRVFSPPRALWIASVGVIVYVLLCAALAAGLPSVFGPGEDGDTFRFTWFALRPVGAGTLAALAVVASLSALLRRPPTVSRKLPRNIPRVALGLGLLPLVVILLLTKARGPLLACIAGACVLLFYQVRPRRRLELAAVGTALILFTMMLGPDVEGWLATQDTRDSAFSTLLLRGQRSDDVLALSGRLELWEEVRPLVAHRILLGYGYQGSRGPLLDIASWAGYAHNAFLQTLLDLGVAGCIALIAVLAAALIAPFTTRDGDRYWLRAAAAGLMVFLLLNALSSESFSAAPGIELLLVFLCALAGAPSASVTRPT
jgi:hypothetical protein